MVKLSIGDCLGFAWETLKTRPGILLGMGVLALLPSLLAYALFPAPEIGPDGPSPEQLEALPAIDPMSPLLAFVLVGLSLLVSFILITFFLRAHDDIAGVTVADAWDPRPFLSFLGAAVLCFIVIAIGLVLLVVPGIIAGLGLAFAILIVIDRGKGPVEAIKESWRIADGNKGELFLLFLTLAAISLVLSLAALSVYLIVPVVGDVASWAVSIAMTPFSYLALIHAYRTLEPNAAAA